MTESELAEAVAQAFEVDATRAKSDVALFLEQLRGEKALQTVDGPGSGRAGG
jgi:nucleoid DNA-binding protein